MHFDQVCCQSIRYSTLISLEVFDEAENFLRGFEDFWNHVIINRAGPVGWKYAAFKNRARTH